MPEPAPITWRQIRRDFLKPSRSQLIIAVVLMLCAYAMVTQVRSQAADETYSSLRRSDLVAMLDDLTRQSRSLDAEINSLENTKRQLQSGVDAREIALEEATRRSQTMGILAGTLPAQGPGVRITIYDPSRKVTPDMLLNAIEEMRDAGAEVIELNDSVRLVASSWVGMKGDSLVVDGQVLSYPIVINAIGDPPTLAEAAKFRGGLISSVESDQVGGRVTLTQEDNLQILSLHKPAPMQFARPA